MKITKRELKLLPGIVLISLFTWYLMEPVKNYIDANFSISPVLIGAIGIGIVLYFFNVNGTK